MSSSSPSSPRIKPCLSFGNDDDEYDGGLQLCDVAPVGASSYWSAFHSSDPKRTVHVMRVYGDREPFPRDFVRQVGRVLQSHPELHALQFHDCVVDDLSPLLQVVVTTARGAPRRDKLLTLQFIRCRMQLAGATSLQTMLQSSTPPVLEQLLFKNCMFDPAPAKALETGLKQNRSLLHFDCVSGDLLPSRATPLQGVKGLLENNDKLVRLGLSVKEEDAASFWNVFQAAPDQHPTLQTLHMIETHLEVEAVQIIASKCQTMPALQELCFSWCNFSPDAMKCLIQSFSNHASNQKILDRLLLDHVTLDWSESPLEDSCGTMQVRQLCLHGTTLVPAAFRNMMIDVAQHNPVLQSMEFRQGAWNTKNQAAVEQLCGMLGSNQGPTEVIIDDIGPAVDRMVHALQQHNTRITSLSMGIFSTAGLLAFVQGLAHMASLCQLCLVLRDEHGNNPHTNHLDQVLPALVVSLEHNTTLETLELSGLDPNHAMVQRYAPQIRHALALNRIGRDKLVGLWAHVLAKTSQDAAGIHYCLRRMPQICHPQS